MIYSIFLSDRNWYRQLFRIVIVLFITISYSSCAPRKAKESYDDSSEGNVELSNMSELSKFVQTIDLNKLCNPVKLLVIFSVDSTGRTWDSDFMPLNLSEKECLPDSTYINELKIKFEENVPTWKTTTNAISKQARYSIPITFR